MLEHQRMFLALAADNSAIAELAAAAQLCVRSLSAGHKILLAGNGGSAAQAQHIAAELVGRYALDRPGLSAIALTTDTSVRTAIGNDCGMDAIFARQIQAHGSPGDVFIALTTSGKSRNILAALEQARENGIQCIGVTGGGGQGMQPLCDVLIVAPSEDTARIQEAHMFFGHVVCSLVENALYGTAA